MVKKFMIFFVLESENFVSVANRASCCIPLASMNVDITWVLGKDYCNDCLFIYLFHTNGG